MMLFWVCHDVCPVEANTPRSSNQPTRHSGLSQFLSREVTKLDRPELTAAHIIVLGGRGLGSGENYTKVVIFNSGDAGLRDRAGKRGK
jgi:electron transfer flavoprotein alpha subunit